VGEVSGEVAEAERFGGREGWLAHGRRPGHVLARIDRPTRVRWWEYRFGKVGELAGGARETGRQRSRAAPIWRGTGVGRITLRVGSCGSRRLGEPGWVGNA
jgi:hypothetical protein